MTPRQRERCYSVLGACVLALAIASVFGWWMMAVVVVLLVVAWLASYYVPLVLLVKRAKRKL